MEEPMDFLTFFALYDSIDNSMVLADASPEAFTPAVSTLSNFMQVFFCKRKKQEKSGIDDFVRK